MSEWIKWEGGECPVVDGTIVEIKIDGRVEEEQCAAEEWRWCHNGSSDITEFRVVVEEAKDIVPDKKGPLKDSGERRETGTGAVRDRAQGKGRFDLIPMQGMLLCAMQMEAGAAKYSERNWEKGMPLSWFADSAQRHLGKFIAGYDDEPHLSAAIWNLMCLAEGQERIKQNMWPQEFDDLPHTYAGKQPSF